MPPNTSSPSASGPAGVYPITPAPKMRAKMYVGSISYPHPGANALALFAVATGNAEDNSFAASTPCAKLDITIENPALVGTFKCGDTFYLDFTPVIPAPAPGGEQSPAEAAANPVPEPALENVAVEVAKVVAVKEADKIIENFAAKADGSTFSN